MIENTDSITSKLQSLRLPELQARYREVFGEDTRCPNRTYLVRKIRERLEGESSSREPEAVPPSTAEIDQAVALSDEDVTEVDETGSPQPERDDTVTEHDATDEASPQEDDVPTAPDNTPPEEAEEPTEPDSAAPEAPPAHDDERPKPASILDEEESREHAVASPQGDQSPDHASVESGGESTPRSEEDDESRDRTRKPGRRCGRFASMTVEELQAMYLATVGRPSSSRHPAYLQWKIREAERGRVPVGPRKVYTRQGDPVEVRVLPLRLEAATVAAIDEAWRERGMKTRMEFLRRALGHYLEHLGASEAAARVEGGSAA